MTHERRTRVAVVGTEPRWGPEHARVDAEPGTSSHPHANLIQTQSHDLDMLVHLCGPIDSVATQMTDRSGRDYSTLAATTATSAVSLGLRVGFLRRPPAREVGYWS